MRPFHVLGAAALSSVLIVSTAAAAPPDDDTIDQGPPQDDNIVGAPISWSIVPATSDGDPADGVSFRLELEPGSTVTEHVLVTNYSEQPITFQIEGSDGVVSPEGAFDVLPPGDESVDVGAWIDIESTVEADAGESVLLPFTITVPEQATPGDHPGGIVAGVASASSAEDGPQVGLMSRVGVRVHLRVTGDVEPAVAISDVDVSYDGSLNPFAPGRLKIRYTVDNVGNVRLSSSQQAEIAASFGLPTGADTGPGGIVGQQREILPGQQATVEAEVEGVWPLGRLSTEIVASQQSAGDDPPLDGLNQTSVTASVWAVPWTQLLIVVVAVVAFVVWRRRRRHERAKVDQLIADARAEGEREAATVTASSSEGS